jgi:hypothetical protein
MMEGHPHGHLSPSCSFFNLVFENSKSDDHHPFSIPILYPRTIITLDSRLLLTLLFIIQCYCLAAIRYSNGHDEPFLACHYD